MHDDPPSPEETAAKLAELTERSGRQQRAAYARRPKKIDNVMAQLFAKRGYGAIETNRQLAQAWVTAVGPAMAKFTRVAKINRGRLEVTVGNSAMLQELTFQKPALLKSIQQALPDNRITDLRFKSGRLPK